MNGVHDMGGMHGFGPVTPEKDEPVFHAAWEGRVFAMQRATGLLGYWNIDIGRAAVEKLPPHIYLGVTYYEKWHRGLEARLLSFGLVSEDEFASRACAASGEAGQAQAHAPPMSMTLCSAASTSARSKRRLVSSLATRCAPRTSTRPRIRGCRAMRAIASARSRRSAAVTSYPDSVVLGKGEDPQWLYTVVFDGTELWGPDAAAGLKVSIEAFEPYLEPA